MSSKRRKILQSRKPSTNVQQLVAENVRQVLSSNKKTPTTASSSRSLPPTEEIIDAISNDPAVLSAYREEIRANASQRLRNDRDEDDLQHPHSSKAFK
jgi:large proline-rich protein BAG6